MDLGEYPEIDTEQAYEPLDNSIEFFLANEVLCGCYRSFENIISIYALCPRITSDLPYMEDIVHLIDHETIHWVLFMFIDLWASYCFDEICGDVDDWTGMRLMG